MIQGIIAQESSKTLKAREKVRRHMEAADRVITPQALKQAVIEIHRLIARHASDRVTLKNKSICLFDQNEHAVGPSQKISRFYEKHKS